MSREMARRFLRSYLKIRYVPYVREICRNLIAQIRKAS
jgi:hypothetical protein